MRNRSHQRLANLLQAYLRRQEAATTSTPPDLALANHVLTSIPVVFADKGTPP